jgi:hypothetical protein
MSPAEAAALRLAARALVAALVVLAAIPAYLTLGPTWRAVAIRLACTVAVVAISVRVVRGVRRAIEAAPPFELDAAAAAPAPPELDERFVRLRDELRFSVRSRRYFDTVLWPRLAGLAGPGLAAPPDRRRARRDGPAGRGRGPSRDTLERLVTEAERRA